MQSKLLQKQSYGMDSSGEVYDSSQKNIEETSEPQERHETPHNQANTTRDVAAEREFPEIRPHSNRFPSRRAKS
jgi:hypothetical protein